MHWVVGITLKRRTVRKLHYAAKLIPLRARRKIHPYQRLQQPRNLAL